MRNKFYLLTVILIFVFSGLAKSHPLGNFSINQYTGVEVDTNAVQLRQFLDMAEIPTFQELQNIDTDKNGSLSDAELNIYLEKISPDYIANLILSVDGKTIQLQPTAKNISLREGAGNLKTLRIEWILTGDLPVENLKDAHKLNFENKNYPERVGWNEIVVGRISGINIFNSNAFGSGISNELNAYPQESLNAPLAERTAEFSFTSANIPAEAKVLQNRDGHKTAAVQKDRFAELISVTEITPTIIFFGLLLAFGLGAMHAMSPGHGKTVVGAYLVGSKGTPKHAIFLGLTVTITHTLGVFALGLLTLFASNYILPERLMPFLNFFSGLIVLFIGLTLFKDRLLQFLGYKTDSHKHHDHVHPHHAHDHDHQSHDHDHDHHHAHDGLTHTHGGSTHTHLPPENVTWKSLLALGISGGLLPCPSALVLMLAAIANGRIGYGIVLTLMFSLGLAATLTCIGLAFLYLGKVFENKSFASHPIMKGLPVFSAFVIACLGAVICYQSL
jgi:ABC-type nickel/cobalt efflux system permease component RcnA